MEVIYRGTTFPWPGRLARRIFGARARGRHEQVCEGDVCKTGAGPTRTSRVGAEVSTIISEMTRRRRDGDVEGWYPKGGVRADGARVADGARTDGARAGGVREGSVRKGGVKKGGVRQRLAQEV
jgi:hypothetical protein